MIDLVFRLVLVSVVEDAVVLEPVSLLLMKIELTSLYKLISILLSIQSF